MSTDTEWEVHGGSGAYYADSEADAREVFADWSARYPHWDVKLFRIEVVRTAVAVDERKRTRGAAP